MLNKYTKEYLRERFINRKNVFVSRERDTAIAFTLDDSTCVFTNRFTLGIILSNDPNNQSRVATCIYEYSRTAKRAKDIVIDYIWSEGPNAGKHSIVKPIPSALHKELLLEMIK